MGQTLTFTFIGWATTRSLSLRSRFVNGCHCKFNAGIQWVRARPKGYPFAGQFGGQQDRAEWQHIMSRKWCLARCH